MINLEMTTDQAKEVLRGLQMRRRELELHNPNMRLEAIDQIVDLEIKLAGILSGMSKRLHCLFTRDGGEYRFFGRGEWERKDAYGNWRKMNESLVHRDLLAMAAKAKNIISGL